jgi:hypothetical protein
MTKIVEFQEEKEPLVVSEFRTEFHIMNVFSFVIYLVIPYHTMEGSPHKHKRTIAQDFLTKSVSQSIELNLSLNRYSFSTDHSGPLTLRVTHNSGPE